MRLKITLSLFAILLALLTYILYIDPKDDRGQFPSERKTVLGEAAVGIDYLSIRNPNTGTQTTFELRNKRWFLTEPYEWPANEFAVESILTQLRFLERVTSFDTFLVSETGASLSDYGLAPPEISLVFGREGYRHVLGIGKGTEIGNHLYILSLDEGQVHVVNRSLLDSLSADLDDLRSPRLFETAVFEANSWNIQVRDNTRNLRAHFSRIGDDWVFETPIRARGDSAAINTLLNRCLNLEAESIVASNPSDLSPYGLQSPAFRIGVEYGERREVLEIGDAISEESDLRYAKREDRPTVFRLQIDFLDLLANAQTKLRERRIFEIDVELATTITIEKEGAPSLTLQKLENEAWEIVVRDIEQGLQTMRGDTRVIEEALLWLDELKAVPDTGFVNDAPSAPDLESYGLEVPEFTITVTVPNPDADSEEPSSSLSETLQIGDPSHEDRLESYVKIADKDFVYSIYNDLFDRIDASPIRYKNRRVVEFPEGSRIQSVMITQVADQELIADFSYPIADAEAEAEAPPAPSEEAQTLADVISTLTVREFIPGGFTSRVEIAGRIKPWTYKVEIDGSEEATSEALVIYVSETTGGPLLVGGIPSQNLSFRFDQDFIDAFTAISFNRVPREVPEQPFSETPLPASPEEEEAISSPEQNPAESPSEDAADTILDSTTDSTTEPGDPPEPSEEPIPVETNP